MSQRTIAISAIQPSDVDVLRAALAKATEVARAVAPGELIAPAPTSSWPNAGDRMMILSIATDLDQDAALALGDELVRRIGNEVSSLESLDCNIASTK